MGTPSFSKREESELSLNDYWYIIRKRKRLAITFFVIVVCSATVYSFLQPKIYKATTTILIERGAKNILSFESVFPVQTGGLDYYPTQHKILKSRAIAKRVMDDLNLWPQYSGAADPVEAFIRQTEIEPVKESRLVKVSAFSQNPEQAADVADAMVKFYIEQNLDNKLAMTQQAADWIQGRIGEVRERLSRSESQLEVVKLKKEVLEVEERYLPKHPRVIRARGRLKTLEEQLGRDMISNLDAGKLAAIHNQLEREVESTKKVYETMLGRLKETMVSKGMEDTNVIVIDSAEVPRKPVSPRILLNIVLSIFVGLFGGAGLCLVLHSWDNTLKSPEEIERIAELPVLGIIGKWNAKQKPLIVHEGRTSPQAECFRAIRTSLLFSSPDHPLRTLLVTSPFAEEGKTIVASNLALALAQSGSSVLLVDADLRKPRINQVFEQKGTTAGLTHALSNVTTDPSKLIYKTPMMNLSVLFSGPLPPASSELLGSQKMRDLVRRLSEDFDYVIFDSSPFMAVTDPVVLGSFVDGVILITRYDKTPKQVLARGRQLFEEVQAKIVGVVLNGVAFDQERYRYMAYSYYGYPPHQSQRDPFPAGAEVGVALEQAREGKYQSPAPTTHRFPP